MATMRLFLVCYNNKDVIILLSTLVKQEAFYGKEGLDMFKTAMSVRGFTLRYLFKTKPENVSSYSFFLKRKKTTLHATLCNNITGGPSIIFHRQHEAGETHVSKGPPPPHEVVLSIKGYDANVLYLHALM